MALTTRDRTQIHTKLAPVIGEKEAETLLDQFPSSTDTELATLADLKAVEARLDHRIDLVEARLDAKIDRVEERLTARIDLGLERLEKAMHKALRQQTMWMIATIVTVLALAARTNLFG